MQTARHVSSPRPSRIHGSEPAIVRAAHSRSPSVAWLIAISGSTVFPSRVAPGNDTPRAPGIKWDDQDLVPGDTGTILRYLQKYCAAVESLARIRQPSNWMVSQMVQSAATDAVFHALSNPTRRKVLERLSVGPATVSELAAPFDMQLPSFVQHLSVLEESRLVKSKKRGRVRTYEIAPERFQVVENWLTARRQVWEARLDRFDQYVKQLKAKESES